MLVSRHHMLAALTPISGAKLIWAQASLVHAQMHAAKKSALAVIMARALGFSAANIGQVGAAIVSNGLWEGLLHFASVH